MGLEVTSFDLSSSSEISDMLKGIEKVKSKKYLIHITSYLHNTVLVQTLKLELSKLLPEAKVVLFKHQDKSNTTVTVYTTELDQESEFEELSDLALKEFQVKNTALNEELKSCKKELLNKYFTDNLTHLPNIYQLRKDLQDNDNAGLVVLNIDNFKTINNFYGFTVGDFIIEQVANYLIKSLHEYKLYRLSGDEFAFVLEHNMGFYDLKKFMVDLYDGIKNLAIQYQDNRIFVDLTLASCSNVDTEDIFSKVSMALRYAKDNSLPFWIYEDRMHFENEYEKNLKTSHTVRVAVENSKIIPYFQPIVDNQTLKITKFECLARLVDENDNVISPVLFIPIAKKIKVYNLVTKTIIDKAFEAFRDNDYAFSINLSIEDILSSEIFEFILSKLKESKASNRVTFELVESEAIQDFKKVERFIYEIKRYGAKIAIDDFGSGYSNFSYLTKMNVDYIKIDGSLIKSIDIDKNLLLVVETIVDFAKKLGVKTIAEYVHTSTIMDKVKELGIDYSQGFYIDRPSIGLKNSF